MSDGGPVLIPLSKLARVLGNPMRWRILLELAKGEALPVKELARRISCSPDLTSKHLAILRRVGFVMTGYGHLYQLVPALRPEPGGRVLDLGHCLLRLG